MKEINYNEIIMESLKKMREYDQVTNNKLSSILLPLYALFLMIFLSIFTPQYFPF